MQFLCKNPANQKFIIVEGDNKQVVAAKIFQNNLEYKQIKAIGQYNYFQKQSLTEKLKADFLFDLGELLEAQYSITQALRILKSTVSHPILVDVITFAQWYVNNGKPLSKVFADFSQFFDHLQIQCIKLAEETGKLPSQLIYLGNYYKDHYEHKKLFKKAIRYPLFLTGFTLVITLILQLVVVPKFAENFAAINGKIPHSTQMLFDFSAWLQLHIWHIGVIVVTLLIVWFVLGQVKPQSINLIKSMVMRLPVFNTFNVLDIRLYFAQSILAIANSGISFEQAFQYMQNQQQKPMALVVLKSMVTDLQNGMTLAATIGKQAIFDTYFKESFVISDNNQAIQNHMNRLVATYQKNINHKIQSITQWLEPMLILAIGGLISFLLVTIYLPLFQLGQIY